MPCHGTLYRACLVIIACMLVPGLLAVDKRQHINCRLYVFHPRCRGVSAKRAYVMPEHTEDNNAIPDGKSRSDMALRNILSSYRLPEYSVRNSQREENLQDAWLRQAILAQVQHERWQQQNTDTNNRLMLPALLMNRGAQSDESL